MVAGAAGKIAIDPYARPRRLPIEISPASDWPVPAPARRWARTAPKAPGRTPIISRRRLNSRAQPGPQKTPASGAPEIEPSSFFRFFFWAPTLRPFRFFVDQMEYPAPCFFVPGAHEKSRRAPRRTRHSSARPEHKTLQQALGPFPGARPAKHTKAGPGVNRPTKSSGSGRPAGSTAAPFSVAHLCSPRPGLTEMAPHLAPADVSGQVGGPVFFCPAPKEKESISPLSA